MIILHRTYTLEIVKNGWSEGLILILVPSSIEPYITIFSKTHPFLELRSKQETDTQGIFSNALNYGAYSVPLVGFYIKKIMQTIF